MSEFKFIKTIEEKVGSDTFENNLKLELAYQIKRIADGLSKSQEVQKELSTDDDGSLATEKQKNYMKALNVNIPENCTKKSAFQIIKNIKEKQS